MECCRAPGKEDEVSEDETGAPANPIVFVEFGMALAVVVEDDDGGDGDDEDGNGGGVEEEEMV